MLLIVAALGLLPRSTRLKIINLCFTCNFDIPYSGLFLKQKFSQERQKLNFEELNFRRLQILKNFNRLMRVRKMALTISSVVNKKRQRMAIIFFEELPCSPEQILFVKIVMPRGQNIPKGTDLDGHSFCCFKAATA